MLNAIETRVFPVPVAWTINAFLCFLLKVSQTALINWEKRILDCFNSDSDIGIASPVASGSGLWDIPFNQGMNFEMMDKHVEKVSKKEYPVVLCPEGFCFAIRRECFNEINLTGAF